MPEEFDAMNHIGVDAERILGVLRKDYEDAASKGLHVASEKGASYLTAAALTVIAGRLLIEAEGSPGKEDTSDIPAWEGAKAQDDEYGTETVQTPANDSLHQAMESMKLPKGQHINVPSAVDKGSIPDTHPILSPPSESNPPPNPHEIPQAKPPTDGTSTQTVSDEDAKNAKKMPTVSVGKDGEPVIQRAGQVQDASGADASGNVAAEAKEPASA